MTGAESHVRKPRFSYWKSAINTNHFSSVIDLTEMARPRSAVGHKVKLTRSNFGPSVNTALITSVRKQLQLRLDRSSEKRLLRVQCIMSKHCVDFQATSTQSARSSYELDIQQQVSVSALLQKTGMSLVEAVRLWRGEDSVDDRPNKALDHDSLSRLLIGFPQRETVLSIVLSGVEHEFVPSHFHDGIHTPPPNHKSALEMSNALLGSIRSGQDNGHTSSSTWTSSRVGELSISVLLVVYQRKTWILLLTHG